MDRLTYEYLNRLLVRELYIVNVQIMSSIISKTRMITSISSEAQI